MPKPTITQSLSSTSQPGTPRQFHLSRPSTPIVFSPSIGKRSRKAELALFVEKRSRKMPVGTLPIRSPIVEGPAIASIQDISEPQREQVEGRKLKRPSARNRNNAVANTTESAASLAPEVEEELDAWAEQTEEAEREAKRTASSKPAKLIEPKIRDADEDLDMNDVDVEDEYVYDTYIRHPVSADALIDHTASIGHLVISEEDEELWQTYIDDDTEDREFDTDDEDSNGPSVSLHIYRVCLT
jgi:hypothetical protein